MLAKHALSQLSYTPTVGLPFILKHFSQFQNLFLTFRASGLNPYFETNGNGTLCRERNCKWRGDERDGLTTLRIHSLFANRECRMEL